LERKAKRSSTSTSNFGVGKREGHDSSLFYARFVAPEITRNEAFVRWKPEDPFVHGDSSSMDIIPDNSVALVVTSPPYFVGKEYEEALGEGRIPATYLEYLAMLRSVFQECKKKLEPGGRIAVNVANLGRKPYRSLSSDVIRILQDDLELLLRGEVIWKKGEGANGSCAWGSFRQPRNPVLRDITERVIIASKGRFDRAKSSKQREEEDLPYRSDVTADEFMEATLDVWEIAPERATRVSHPAPFPVELPQRLIELYTYEGDLVLDPFMGSGSTLVAAARTSRLFIGYDLDEKYVAIARERVGAEEAGAASDLISLVPVTPSIPENNDYEARANIEGKTAQGIAKRVLEDCGFEIVSQNSAVPRLGVVINYVAKDKRGEEWHFDVSGAFTTPRAGLLRTDTLWKCLGRALVLRKAGKERIVLLTTHLPLRKSTGDQALRSVGPETVFDAIEMLSDSGLERLKQYATGQHDKPLPGFWTGDEPLPDASRNAK